MMKNRKRLSLILSVLLACFTINACNSQNRLEARRSPASAAPTSEPVLFIGVLKNHFSFQKILDDSLGYENDLMTLFAAEQGQTPVFIEYESAEALTKDLANDRLQVGIGSWPENSEQKLSNRVQVLIEKSQAVLVCNQASAFNSESAPVFLRDQDSDFASLYNNRAKSTSETDAFVLLKRSLEKPNLDVSFQLSLNLFGLKN